MTNSDNEEIESKFTEYFFRTAGKEMAELKENFENYRTTLRRKKFEGDDGEKAKGIGFCIVFERFFETQIGSYSW